MDKKIHDVLAKLEATSDNHEKFWNVSPSTGKFLNMIARLKAAKNVLEIGTSNGYSGLWLAEALSHNEGKLYTVESHRQRFDLAGQHFEEAGVSYLVEQLFGHAPEIFFTEDFQKLGVRFDMVFLDATKMEYLSYFNAVAELMNKGAVLFADNVISHAKDVADFVEDIQKRPDFDCTEIPLGSGLFMALKDS